MELAYVVRAHACAYGCARSCARACACPYPCVTVNLLPSDCATCKGSATVSRPLPVQLWVARQSGVNKKQCNTLYL